MRAIICLIAVLFLPVAYSLEPTIAWELKTSGKINSLDGSGDLILVGDDEGYVYLLNTSGLIWKVSLSTEILDVALDEYIVACDDSSVFLLNKSGYVLWETTKHDNYETLDTKGNKIISGTPYTKYLYAFDEKGNLLWKKSFEEKIKKVKIGKHIVVATSKGKIYFLKENKVVDEANINRYIYDIDYGDDKVLVAVENRVAIIKNGVIKSLKYYEEPTCIEFIEANNSYIVGDRYGELCYFNNESKKIWCYKFNSPVKDVASPYNGEYIVVAVEDKVYLLYPPSVSQLRVRILSPKNGENVSGIVEIKAEISKENVTTIVTIDGNYACALPCKWDTSASSIGKHVIKVRVIDQEGNVAEDEVEVTITREKAEVKINKTIEKEEEKEISGINKLLIIGILVMLLIFLLKKVR